MGVVSQKKASYTDLEHIKVYDNKIVISLSLDNYFHSKNAQNIPHINQCNNLLLHILIKKMEIQ